MHICIGEILRVRAARPSKMFLQCVCKLLQTKKIYLHEAKKGTRCGA